MICLICGAIIRIPESGDAHWRPGGISALAGTAAIAVLGAAALLMAVILLPPLAGACIGVYVATTIAYRASLKERPIVDVATLACQYSLRILAGAAAIELMPSPSMLAFSMFLFLSLALGKRFTELVMSHDPDRLPFSRRTYRIEDAPLMLALGACAGQMSVLTMALYWSDPITHMRFSNRVVGWLICPLLLFWLCR